MRISRSVATLAVTGLLGTGLAVLPVQSASAVQNGTVPGTAASTWQTNGVVRAITAANGIVYIGGDFTAVRPPGAAAGAASEVARNHFAAFNASTGALITTINHNVSAPIYSLSTSSNGATVYMGGDFTTVDGAARNRVAAFNASTNALTSWAPNVNARVNGIVATASTVYVSGAFSKVGSVAVTRVAAINAANNNLLAGFSASADASVYAIALSKPGDKLYLAGGFTSVNGDSSYHSAAVVDASTGSLLPLPARSVIPPKTASCTSEMKVVKTDADSVYFGAEGTGGGCFDGTFAANISDGSLKWQSQCLGATQGLTVVNGLVYTGSHSHDCTADQGFDPDAFPEVGWSKGLARHLLARSAANGKVSSWYPNTDGGPGGVGLGPRVLETDGSQVFVGGEFTNVNGQAQQGFTRFSPTASADAAPARPAAPAAVARPNGAIAVSVQAPLDTDDTDLTVRIYRDGGTTPIASVPVHSLFWRDPVVSIVDSAVAVGTSHTYTADAIETNGTVAGAKSSASNRVTAVQALSSYASAVNGDSPTLFWRLGQTGGSAAADSSGNGVGGIYAGGVTYNQPGQTSDGDTGIQTDGINGLVSSSEAVAGPSTFSIEAWIKTTTTTGGKIIGFGNRQGGYDFSGNPAVSGSYDKQLYMANDGRVLFGVYNGNTTTLASSAAYNDGQWHHLVGTQDSGGMALWADGVRLGRNSVTTNQSYTGYWRVGGDSLGSWPSQPSSNFFAGSIDDVAVYGGALTRTQVLNHYTASGRSVAPGSTPQDTYGKAVVADDPQSYWRLDDAAATTAADSADGTAPGAYAGGVTTGAAGALGTTGKAATFDGVNGNVASASQVGGPSKYAVELWFNTTTTRGGKLIGFGNSKTGNSGNYDKHVYMLNNGRLSFGVYNGGFDIITSTAAYNDGAWHHVVAMQGPSGMAMYVDDRLVGTNPTVGNQSYNGYWRVGGDNLGAWPNRPASDYFAGTIDEVAVYGGPLSATQVDAHYSASGRQGPDTTAPVTAITSPADGASLLAGDVAVTATATDAGGVASVDLQVDGTTVTTRTTAPYTFTWNATAGTHVLTTVARDASGNVGSSAPVNVTVTVPDTTAPSVAITSPAGGASVYGATTVQTTATDNVAIASVDLKVDGTTVATTSTTPYSFMWDASSVSVGSHTLVAVARDTSGNVTSSAPVSVTVVLPPDTTAPSAPSGLSATAATDHVTLTWTAATDDRGVGSYRVVRDGVVLPDVVSGTTFTDTAVATSTTYHYSVQAVDTSGNIGPDSNVVTVRTPDTTNPVVSIGSPTIDDQVYGPTPVVVNATDDTGIASVSVKVDGSSLGTDTTAPYEFTWNATVAGNHTLVATATDTSGNSATSEPIVVTVVVPPDTTAPTAPTALHTTATTVDHVDLAWTASTDNVGVTGYEVLRDGAVVGTSAGTTYTDSTVSSSSNYSYSVRARDAANNVSVESAALAVTTPDVTVPTVAITSPAAGDTVSGATTVTVTAGDDVSLASVKLTVDGAAVATLTSAPFTFTWNATGSGQRTLVAVATDAAGNTASSDPVTVSVVAPADTTAPSVPTGLHTTAVAKDHVDLAWTASTDNVGVTGYEVLRDSTVLATVTGTSWSDTGVTPSTAYTYTVRALDAAGNRSTASGSVTVTTPAATTTLFNDPWTGADGAPWASAWTTSSSSGSVTTQGGAGVLAPNDASGAYARAQLTGVSAKADTDTVFSYKWSATGASQYVDIYVRGTGGWQNGYRPRNGYGLELSSSSGTVALFKNVNGTNSTIRTVSSAQKLVTTKQWVRIKVSGSTIQWHIWSDGTTEPTAWNTDTDTSVTAAGQLFLAANRGSSNTGAKSVAIDDLTITDLTP
ncbi:concanavalin A-like lectin/glucanase superfamily protein [Motilibacter peucedani]|uniref:Concanavalin A-like lectin/glucanase superfamily protein n=1 Tax=Motilibacter peucedani TaxID=598650 RepID=A0A420XLE0_9ACTN|nr:Ig-like domain-containing protein [Motilibacter peucedani]RKS71325.1 concanavalin A-like lectin/glucanase superfamily protein [Motilibacter peucedani]